MLVKHGHKIGGRQSKQYTRWRNMLKRCYSESHKQYERYGGRGIYVCDRWHSFIHFHEDMGNPPDGMSLDRIDNNGPYSPENCRWATAKTQTSNRANVIRVIIDGRELTLKEAAHLLGVHYNTVHNRYAKFGDPYLALNAEKGKHIKKRNLPLNYEG